MNSTRKMIARVGALTLALAMVLALPIASAAGLAQKTITVSTGVDLVVDGVDVIPTDVNGKPVETFLYNGTTYVPIRAITQIFGKGISWDGTTGTVYIGEQPGAHQWLLDVCPPYQTDEYDAPTTVTMAGQKYPHCFSFRRSDNFALFNLNAAYNTLEFDLGHIDGEDMYTATLNIYLDGELSFSLDLDPEMLPTHYSVPLYGALQMKIEIVGVWLYNYALANVEVH